MRFTYRQIHDTPLSVANTIGALLAQRERAPADRPPSGGYERSMSSIR